MLIGKRLQSVELTTLAEKLCLQYVVLATLVDKFYVQYVELATLTDKFHVQSVELAMLTDDLLDNIKDGGGNESFPPEPHPSLPFAKSLPILGHSDKAHRREHNIQQLPVGSYSNGFGKARTPEDDGRSTKCSSFQHGQMKRGWLALIENFE
ncbi:hypothetical protein CEXT_209101 [Caerostris extrusa]|uniref:Uncharacterized protein n=1 Tax=Caerostris extrusa TaxID=172846 RepID=A0AAV4MG06_CAEEX|nr:hypothetical protein CEXT_209101 [Caerostris extrusa]